MSRNAPAVRLRGVGKRYGGARRGRWALRGVDLSFSAGEVIGFIGPNGAGKTTLIRLMSGLSPATEGDVEVQGHDLGAKAVTPVGIGLVVEHPTFIPYLSGRKNLELLARIRGAIGRDEIAATLRMVGLDPASNQPTRAYSLGMRQRLGLAQALMEDPRLLLLDEPTNGLDPAGIIDLRNLIRRLAGDGVAVFTASHLLTEVERVCDRVLLVRAGRVIKEIDQRAGVGSRILRLTVAGEADLGPLHEWGPRAGVAIEAIDDVSPLVLRLLTDLPVPQVVKELVEASVSIEDIGPARRSLEEEFMDSAEAPAP